MIRHYQILSIAAVAVFPLTAVSSAAAAEFHSEVAPTTLKGSLIGTALYTTNSSTVECEEESYTGSQWTTTAATMELEVSLSGCSSLSGFASRTIDTNGCKDRFAISSVTSATTYDGTTDIACPAGKEITWTSSLFGVSKCTTHIPPQAGLKNLEFHDEGSGSTRDVKVTINITGIRYSQTAGSGSFACQTALNQTNGSYVSEATFKAFEGTKQKGFWVA